MEQRAVQIVCTIGPASRDPATLTSLIDAGMNVARINCAHASPSEQRELVGRIRAAARARSAPVAVLQDLAGPKLRIGELHLAPLALEAGARVTLACGRDKGEPGVLPVPDAYLVHEVDVGAPILLGDGALELEVIEVDDSELVCRVVVGGEVSHGQGISAPGGTSGRPILDERDRADLRCGAELGVDLVGVSYVRTAADLATVRRELSALGRETHLVAKLETAAVLEHLDDVLQVTDSVMIARGDLSLAIPYERVPIEQKRITCAAIRAGRPVITATQMLQSMVRARRPTRAEITDVANAVLDGTDAVMLSEETAVGADPVRACRSMSRIVRETLAAYPERAETPLDGIAPELRELLVFSRAAVRTARDTGAVAILTWSQGGLAARLLSRQRPGVPILAPTPLEQTFHRLSLPYAVRPILCPGGELSREQLERELGPLDDAALLLAVGHIPGDGRRIPWMGLVRVGDPQDWAFDPRERPPRPHR